MTPKQSWAGLAHAISPDARYGHPALRSIGMGNLSSITDQIPLRVL
jgi:hypothetical protein